MGQMYMLRNQSSWWFILGALMLIVGSPEIHPKHQDQSAVLLRFGVVQAVEDEEPTTPDGVDYVDLCACPVLSACPGNCGRFTVNDDSCQVFYQCFLEVNGLFGYVKVTHTSEVDGEEGIVQVLIYDTNDCSGPPRFPDPSAVGFEGTCTDECWGDTTSKIGAGSCGTSSSTTDPPQPTDPPSSSNPSPSSTAATISAAAAAAAMVSFLAQ